jgi:hypothetical protein
MVYRSPDPTSILEPPQEPPPYTGSIEERQLLGQLRERFDECAEHRRDYDQEIATNRVWLEGTSLIGRDAVTGSVVQIALSPESRNRYVLDNYLRPISRALLGKHCRLVPTFQGVPATADEADVRAAEIQTSYLEHFTTKEKLRTKWVQSHRFTTGAEGTSIWHLYWDPLSGLKVSWCSTCDYDGDETEAGDPCPDCAMRLEEEQATAYQQELGDAEMQGLPPPPPPEPNQEVPILEPKLAGDSKVEVIDPRYFYPEPGVVEIPDMRYIFTRIPAALSTVRQAYPLTGMYCQADDSARWDMPAYGNRGRVPGGAKSDCVWLYRYEERPSILFPTGRLIVYTENVILNKVDEQELWEAHPQSELDSLPYYANRWERRVGVFWGESHITQNWHTQAEYNQFLRQLQDQRKLANNPPILTPLNSKISKDDFHEVTPGKVIKYNPMHGGPNGTKWMDIPPFANYAYNEIERMRLSMREKASVTEQEMGMAPPEQSGRHAAILEAQSSETVKPLMIETIEEYGRLYGDALKVARRRLSDRYIWSVHGQDKVWSYDWAMANKGCVKDVELVEADSLSQNPAIRQEQAQANLKVGFFNDPMTGQPDMEWYGRMAGIKSSRQGPNYAEMDAAYAAALPDKIIEGTFTGPKPWDDATVCAKQLAAWLKGSGREHIEQHQFAVARVWMIYASMAQPPAAQGGPQQWQPNPVAAQSMGGTGPGAGSLATGQQPPGEEANQIVKNADKTGESLTRPASGQEN